MDDYDYAEGADDFLDDVETYTDDYFDDDDFDDLDEDEPDSYYDSADALYGYPSRQAAYDDEWGDPLDMPSYSY